MLSFNLNEQFYEPVQIHNGPESRGIFSTASEQDQPNFEFSSQKLIMRAARDTLCAVGNVILRPKTGERFLLGIHTQTNSYKVFRALKADRLVTWTREATSNDPLTGEPITTGNTSLGSIWVLWDMIRREAPDFGFQVQEERNLVITGEDIQLGDMLDGQEVKRVNIAMGLRIVQVQ